MVAWQTEFFWWRIWRDGKVSICPKELDTGTFSSCKYCYSQMLKVSLYSVMLTCLLYQEMYQVEFWSSVIWNFFLIFGSSMVIRYPSLIQIHFLWHIYVHCFFIDIYADNENRMMQNPWYPFKWTSRKLQCRGCWIYKASITVCKELVGILLFKDAGFVHTSNRSSSW